MLMEFDRGHAPLRRGQRAAKSGAASRLSMSLPDHAALRPAAATLR